jgi:polyisoprenoid-binding protein YceI
MLRTGQIRPAVLGFALGALSLTAVAAPVTYQIDSAHTYPSFEADHNGGLSFWRGKFNSTSGTIELDNEMSQGTVNITIDMNSIDFGHDGLNTHAKTADMFDVEQFPTATFAGRLTNWRDGAPTAVEGELTMHGETHPVTLEILQFACKPVRGSDTCGADAHAVINRGDWGVSFGEQMGLDLNTVLRIQIEAAATE